MNVATDTSRAQASDADRFEYVLRLADTSLVAGQRLAAWLGHGPALEEDLAPGNISLEYGGDV